MTERGFLIKWKMTVFLEEHFFFFNRFLPQSPSTPPEVQVQVQCVQYSTHTVATPNLFIHSVQCIHYKLITLPLFLFGFILHCISCSGGFESLFVSSLKPF